MIYEIFTEKEWGMNKVYATAFGEVEKDIIVENALATHINVVVRKDGKNYESIWRRKDGSRTHKFA